MIRPIEPKRRDMKEFLPWTLDQRRPLMGQVDQLIQVESRCVIVGQWSEVGELGLAYDVRCAWLVEEHVVHDAAPPHHDPMLATEALVSDERVTAAVVVACVVVCSEVVLLFLLASFF